MHKAFHQYQWVDPPLQNPSTKLSGNPTPKRNRLSLFQIQQHHPLKNYHKNKRFHRRLRLNSPNYHNRTTPPTPTPTNLSLLKCYPSATKSVSHSILTILISLGSSPTYRTSTTVMNPFFTTMSSNWLWLNKPQNTTREILKKYQYDYRRTVKHLKNTIWTPGSECSNIAHLQKIWSKRSDWEKLRNMLFKGRKYPLTPELDRKTRIKDIFHQIQRGNHYRLLPHKNPTLWSNTCRERHSTHPWPNG